MPKMTPFILFILLLTSSLFGQTADTTMSINFQVTTSSPGGNYSPRNIGAIWIEDANGQFLQTLKRWANNRRQYLYTWNNRSGGNVTDGVTGATRSNHGTHTVQWDFTSFSGDTVEAGDYVLWIEMTDQHSQGPLYSMTFPYLGATGTLSAPDQDHFHGMELSYDVDIIVGLDEVLSLPSHSKLHQNYPNPFNPATAITYSLGEALEMDLAIIDLQGRRVRTLKMGIQQAGYHSHYWDGRNDSGEPMDAGIYFCSLSAKGHNQTIKMSLLK